MWKNSAILAPVVIGPVRAQRQSRVFKTMESVDKKCVPFKVGEYGAQAREKLARMYDDFGDLAVSQGLPPAERQTRLKWIDKLFEFGLNFIAWRGENAIGHCCVIPDFGRQDAEYIIFVQSHERNKGIGAALTRLALQRTRDLGIRRIWLTVEAFNFRAIRLYKNAGFQFVDDGERERTMILRI